MAAAGARRAYEDTVRPEWVDYNGHMNDSAFAVVFSQAIDALMDWLGIDAAFREENHYTLFTLETHIRYLNEAHEGTPLAVEIELLDHDPKRLHIFQTMRGGADGATTLATCEAMLMGIDQVVGRAAAFLMPIEWEEPFGIVMAEAMACGTPVIGTRRGAVPEVVEEGTTGFVGESVEDLVAAVDRIDELDRAATRERCERLFSDRAVVDGYESLYEEMMNGEQ